MAETVDLREQMNRKKNPAKEDKRLEKLFADDSSSKKDLMSFNHPKKNQTAIPLWIVLVMLVIIGGSVYWLASKKNVGKNTVKNMPAVETPAPTKGWYMVKLLDGEIFYGQVQNTGADPVVVENVYYNYDQANDGKKTATEVGNLRLVKRGKETHGPSGVLNIVRAQVVYLEPLASESKVLKAILENEKSGQ